jgi:hypothetical protein
MLPERKVLKRERTKQAHITFNTSIQGPFGPGWTIVMDPQHVEKYFIAYANTSHNEGMDHHVQGPAVSGPV